MKRILGVGIAAILLAATLTACGGGGGGNDANATGNYCNDITSVKDGVQGLQGGDLTQAKFDELVADIKGIASEAPPEVQNDWQTLQTTVATLNDALKKAGISIDDLQNLGSGGSPSVDPSKLKVLLAATKSLDSSELQKAGDAITKQVKDQCGIDLNAGS